MAYRGDHEYAIVEGDHIMYKGRAISPNQFASGYADSVRNAWQDISIRMPGEKHWKLAGVRPRNTSPGQGWTEPERRKFRFRLEDVAFN